MLSQSLLSSVKAIEACGFVIKKMEIVPKDRILELRPDTLQCVRKLYNLDNVENLKEAVNILHDWVQKQSHFNKKDFSNNYLEGTLIACKGSLERAKSQIDKICTMKTLLPQFFGEYNVKTDFGNLFDIANTLMLPKLTEDHYRVYICKFNNVQFDASQAMDFHRVNIIMAEYVLARDYLSGFLMIIDFMDANLVDYMMKLNPIELRQAMSIYIEGYGMRIKGIHILSQSKFVDTLVTILKQVLSPKVASRINVHKSVEELYKIIPKYVLPKDYGGEERSLKSLQDDFKIALSSKEHINYLREMNKAVTNESCRQKDKFSEMYAGMPGTFRLLSVD